MHYVTERPSECTSIKTRDLARCVLVLSRELLPTPLRMGRTPSDKIPEGQWWSGDSRHSKINHMVEKIPESPTECVVYKCMQNQNRSVSSPVYLPCRSGETMDTLDALLNTYGISNEIVFLGDFNADPGITGGPFCTTSCNEQGRILIRYLRRWGFVSARPQIPTPT